MSNVIKLRDNPAMDFDITLSAVARELDALFDQIENRKLEPYELYQITFLSRLLQEKCEVLLMKAGYHA